MGVFVAWIGTHLVKDRSRGRGVGNLAVCIFGALLGGLGGHAMLRGAHGYHPFVIGAGTALIGAVLLLGITRFFPRRPRRSAVY
jgi:uncharacterized membrane protein YeaQ/YmgE (transglycosylase-associated protein family)